MRESQLDAYDEGAVERPTAIDASIDRRDEIIRQAEGARVGAAWIIAHAAELAALRVGLDFLGGTLLHKVNGDSAEFFVYGEEQTSRFKDSVTLLSKSGEVEIIGDEKYVHVEGVIEDTNYKIKFMFDRESIDENALGAEGKV